MGNCFALCKTNTKSLQIVKMDGKIIELTAPITVSELLVNFSGFGVAVSERASQHLPPTYELKMGKIYYLLPSTHYASSSASTVETEQASGTGIIIKRIKVVITKQQLQELLLSKQISVEDVLSGGLDRMSCRTCSSSSSVVSHSTCVWKPKLQPIPEV